ncbi:MAG: DUF1905 domain-containing protein [bacterium]|nr:DUF1905 domain-containing protein [bacterium]
MKKIFRIDAKVWKWPGDAGWHFVNVEKKVSEQIRNKYKKGFVYITAKTGKTSWDTALFPHKISGSYLLSVKASVRKKENIWEGDTVNINFTFR